MFVGPLAQLADPVGHSGDIEMTCVSGMIYAAPPFLGGVSLGLGFLLEHLRQPMKLIFGDLAFLEQTD